MQVYIHKLQLQFQSIESIVLIDFRFEFKIQFNDHEVTQTTQLDLI